MPLYTPCFDKLVPVVGLIPALVFGLIWRYARMSGHVCRASIQTLAARLGLHRTTVMRAIRLLLEAGLIEDLTPTYHNRPHRLRPSQSALERIGSAPDTPASPAVVQCDSEPEWKTPAGAENDRGSGGERQPAVAESDRNQTLLKHKGINKDRVADLEGFYQEKVVYINQQILAFDRCRSIVLCRYHAYNGNRFQISHPDPFFLQALNKGFQQLYEKKLSLFIPDPGLKVEFVLRELGYG